MSEKLKPCPFCGGGNLEIHDCSQTSSGWFVRCINRQNDKGYHDALCHYSTKDEAITAWNTRPAEALADELGEALRWYANEDNYFPRSLVMRATDAGLRIAPIYSEFGELARQALTKWKESRNG